MRASFENSKGPRSILTLSEADVERLLDPAALIDALADGFAALSHGTVQTPPRQAIRAPGGVSLAMQAWQPGLPICIKIVNVFDANPAQGLPTHLALINLFDPETGAALCVMDATYLTGVRTAAAAMLSARLLARPESRVATVIGAGLQGREHLKLLPLAMPSIEEIRVYSRVPEHAESLAALAPQRAQAVRDLEQAVRGSDIVCLTTNSPHPVIEDSWVPPGCHVTSVGFHPPGSEIPPALAARAAVFVESDSSRQPPPVGCAELSGGVPATTLGDVILKRAPGRIGPAQVTLYKAMGLAMEDMVAANLAYQRALAERVGGQMPW